MICDKHACVCAYCVNVMCLLFHFDYVVKILSRSLVSIYTYKFVDLKRSIDLELFYVVDPDMWHVYCVGLHMYVHNHIKLDYYYS